MAPAELFRPVPVFSPQPLPPPPHSKTPCFRLRDRAKSGILSVRPPFSLAFSGASPLRAPPPARTPRSFRNASAPPEASPSEEPPGDPHENDSGAPDSDPPSPMPPSGLLRNAGFVGAATVASKILGLLREVVLASVFGVGPVATAFHHAAVFPRFCSSFLGGVNGPIHITVATTLSNLSMDRRRQLIQKAHVIMFLVGGAVSAFTYIFAEAIVYISAPGLWMLAEGQLIRQIAITQLKLMTPCILLAGLTVLGFGYLSAEGDNIIPSLSPSITSISIVISCILYVTMSGSNTSNLDSSLTGGIFVSCGASVGALLQWLIQVILHEKTGYGPSSISWTNTLWDNDIQKLFILIIPAILSSGLVQIASFTDLYFASFIPGAAAGLSYAHLMVMAPLGILSSIIVLPLLPLLSRLAKASSWTSLKENLHEGVLVCMVVVLPISSTICMLAGPVIRVLFQRLTFDSTASSFVSSLLLCYSVGSPFFIIRELLVVVFYSLGDGQLLLLVNVIAIFLNAFLDYLSISVLGLGAQGLALSTSCITALSVLLLLYLLSLKFEGIVNFSELCGPLSLLLACCTFSGFVTLISHKTLQHAFSTISISRFSRVVELLSIILSGLIGMVGFYIPLELLQFPALKTLKKLLWMLKSRPSILKSL